MKKISIFFLCFCIVFALLNFSNAKQFSVENYLTDLSDYCSATMPQMPSTEDITKTWEDSGDESDIDILKTIRNIFVTIYNVVIYLFKFIWFIIQYIYFVLGLFGHALGGVFIFGGAS